MAGRGGLTGIPFTSSPPGIAVRRTASRSCHRAGHFGPDPLARLCRWSMRRCGPMDCRIKSGSDAVLSALFYAQYARTCRTETAKESGARRGVRHVRASPPASCTPTSSRRIRRSSPRTISTCPICRGSRPNFPASASRCSIPTTSGITTALFKLDPGAVVPLHEHTALEQTYVHRRLARGSRGQVRPGPVRLATGRQPARGGGAEWRRAARLLPQAEPLRLRREVLHGAGREVASVGWAKAHRAVPTSTVAAQRIGAWASLRSAHPTSGAGRGRIAQQSG